MGAFTMRLLRLLPLVLLLGSVALAQSPPYGVGRTPTPEEIRAWDISISPTGTELPQGHGTAKEGAQVYRAKGCAACHGKTGTEGARAWTRLALTAFRPVREVQIVRAKVTVPEIVARCKAEPGTVTFGSAGQGSAQHLALEMFKLQAGVDALHVPYKGSGPLLTDLMGGQIMYSFETMTAATPHVNNGKVKAIAITSAKRSSILPDVPTFSEAGMKGFESYAWYGFFAPTKTPPDVIARLRRDIRASLPELKERFEKSGGEVWDLPDDKLDAFVASEYDNWTKLIREAGIKLD